MATDPVCGMYVDEATADLKLVRDNRTYYFCAQGCLLAFAQPGKEIARLRWRLAVAWPLAVSVLLLTYLWHPPGWPLIALVLAGIVQFYPGLGFYRGTWDALRGRVWNMDVLIAVGTSVAFGYSLLAVLLPGRLPPDYFFDASAFIVTLILMGNYLEHLVRDRAGHSLRALQERIPREALRVEPDGSERVIPVAEVQVGDRLRVRPGERFPSDGTILEGRTTVEESVVTGESLPVPKGPGAPVLAGTLNGEGVLLVRATQVGEDTFLAQIGRLVTEAEMSRVPLQSLADRIAERFVPGVLVLALLSAGTWLLLGHVPPTIALLVFVTVAITACPCAFGIATPAALLVGTGRAAEEGILFKGKTALERAARVDLVLTDKTGTLTRGRPLLSDVVPAGTFSREEVLALALGLETHSEHPYARAVREESARLGIAAAPVRSVESAPGEGVRGEGPQGPVAMWSYAAVGERGIPLPPPLEKAVADLLGSGKAVSILVEGGRAAGALAFADPLAPGAPEALRALARDGVQVVMVTGDHERAARKLAESVGISRVHAGVSPAGKLEILRRYQAEGHTVAFVGDGINDAPALTAADLGVAIGAGTDVAREAGGVILIRSDFRGVALALRLGRRTVRKVRQNLFWALGYNAVLLPVAAGVLVPLLGLGIYDVLPMVGALAMGLSSTTVVLNSLSLRWTRLDGGGAGRRIPPGGPDARPATGASAS